MTRTPAQARTDRIVRRRALAYAADVVAVLGAVLGLQRVRGRRSVRDAVRGFVVAGLLAGPYHVFLEGGVGQTVGKRLLGIAVVSEEGETPTFRAALTRTLYRFVDWLPVAYGVGLLSMALDGRNRRLGDRAAGTVVVRTDDSPDRTGGRE